MKAYLLIILCPLLLGCSAISKKKENKSKLYLQETHYYFDKTNAINQHNIAEQQFTPFNLNDNNFGTSNGKYWFKFKLAPSNEKLIIDIPHHQIEKINLYKANVGNLVDITSLSKYINVEFIKNTSFQLFNSTNETYYIEVELNYIARFPITVVTLSEHSKNTIKSNTLNGLYYGFVIMVALINLFYFFNFRDSSFLFYVFFLLSIGISFSIYDGYMPQVFWEFLFHYLIVFFGASFAGKYLELPKHIKNVNLYKIIALVIILVLYSLFYIFNNYLYWALAEIVSFFTLAMYWLSGILISKKNKASWFFVVGYSLILITGILFVIPLNFGIPNIGLTLNSVKLGSIFEMLILTVAIIYRMKLIQDDRNYAFKQVNIIQKEQNVILENKVSERTKELQNVNKDLEKQNRELDLKNGKINTLLHEIHHRVKNNFQVVSSLFDLQSKNITDTKSIMTIADGKSRLKTMALLHEKLYQSEDIGLSFKAYCKAVIKDIQMANSRKDVKIEVSGIDIKLDIDTSVPLGLIVNEIVTNAFKYGFDNKKPQLKVSLLKTDLKYQLHISDNGKGFPLSIFTDSNTMGLKLIKRLSKQLHGKAEYDNTNGSQFIIYFKDTFQRKLVN